ncbi:type 2 periplasmic-binding domain-containing protein [Ferruginibacter albus]|uniref:extracellular solute-binding protein n=1 Tax=Ferruginibacter albus TaxID=2875540 RepID=UPI001CC6D650|nr:extracellular solute-binding protein [Ferruginibacter albus]UAY53216.1 hypothetical protein K9M53_05980 [Ferruginibacter albus]
MKQLIIFFGLITLLSCKRTNQNTIVFHAYPFIPNADKFYAELESDFKKQNPNINLIIVKSDNYYDSANGIIKDDTADIYELDCVLLQDFIDRNLIQPFPKTYSIDTSNWLEPDNVGIQEESLYCVPHWLCSNFLFYKKGDKIKDSKNLDDIKKDLGKISSLNKSLLIDLYGKSTLGELYAEVNYCKNFNRANSSGTLDFSIFDYEVEKILNKIKSLTYKDWGRRKDFHDYKEAFYPRQFAKGNGRIFVGHSESLYNILDEINNGCYEGENCLQADQISVMRFPLSDKSDDYLGWMDGLSINKNLSGQKLRNAITFINFLLSKKVYEEALKKEANCSPRYLLPAYKQYYFDRQITDFAPLYPQFYELVKSMNTITNKNLCQDLRLFGDSLTIRINKN